MKIGIYTSDRRLWQKLRLLLGGAHEVLMLGKGDTPLGLSLVLQDIDYMKDITLERAVTMSRKGGADLRIPFRFEEILALTEAAQDTPRRVILLSDSDCTLLFDGHTVKLTRMEYGLISILLSAPVGTYVSRGYIRDRLWQDKDEGVVGVYIHYLRQKLEKWGDKIIISSRSEGYMIDERFRA